MADYVTIPKAAEVTGYSAQAIRTKIHRGVWAEGRVWRRAPDGRILISLRGVEAWAYDQAPESIWQPGPLTALQKAEGRRRAALKRATPDWSDRRAIRAVYDQCRLISRESGVNHHVDHIVPLQGEFVSGLHVPANLRIIPMADNIRKRNFQDEQ